MEFLRWQQYWRRQTTDTAKPVMLVEGGALSHGPPLWLMGKFFLKGLKTGGRADAPPPSTDLGLRELEKLRNMSRQVVVLLKKGRQMLGSQKRSSIFCGREYGPSVSNL
jgi:hypothetical protein